MAEDGRGCRAHVAQHLAEWWPSPATEWGLDTKALAFALCRALYAWGAMAATVPRNSIVWSWQAGGISGCPADGRLLPEQRGLCPSEGASTPSLLLDPTSFSLLCCPFFSLVLRTPKTTQAANEILPKTVARVTGLSFVQWGPARAQASPLAVAAFAFPVTSASSLGGGKRSQHTPF